MTIQDVYIKCAIPENLQLHMLRAAAVGHIIIRHWYKNEIEGERVLLALLLHDLGNVLKFDAKSGLDAGN
jgi:5'-deoxynucleotidase YfbR-like HD superfamily hydrolase